MSLIPLQANDSWGAWANHVLKTMEDQASDIKEIRNSINGIQVEIAMLKVKSGMWGAMGGMIPVLVALMWWIMEK